MNETLLAATNWFAAAGGAVWAIASKDKAADWAQAIGSMLALFLAFWIANKQHRAQMEIERKRNQAKREDDQVRGEAFAAFLIAQISQMQTQLVQLLKRDQSGQLLYTEAEPIQLLLPDFPHNMSLIANVFYLPGSLRFDVAELYSWASLHNADVRKYAETWRGPIRKRDFERTLLRRLELIKERADAVMRSIDMVASYGRS